VDQCRINLYDFFYCQAPPVLGICILAAAETNSTTNGSSTELFAGECPVSSGTAMSWFVDEATVAAKVSLGGSSAVQVCEFVSSSAS
jgi:hypothetical protein